MAERPAGAGHGDEGLRRHLGLLDAIALYVGIILGSGIFVAPAAVAGATSSVIAAVGLWVLVGLVAVCGGLCYAENAARLPRSGGFYVFYREALGDAMAFVGGWAGILVTYPASIAAIALIFASYLRRVVPLPVPETLLAASGILLCAALNAVGLRTGPIAQRILTAAKVGALALLCLAAASAQGGGAERGPAPDPAATATGAALVTALVVVLWTYDGWSDVTLVAGEVVDPRRTLGRAVILGSLALILLYGCVQWAVETVLPGAKAAASGEVVAEAVGSALGEGMGRVVAALVVLCTLGSVQGIVFTSSRLGYAMAKDGVFLRHFGTVHPRWNTPVFSLGWIAGVSCVYVFSGTFDKLIKLFSFSVWVFYALAAVCLWMLRRRGVGGPDAWVAPGGWLPPAVVWVTAVVITSSVMAEEPAWSIRGLAFLLAGFPVYWVWKRRSQVLT